MKIDAYPLQWPVGWKRETYPKSSQFGQHISFGRSRDELFKELKLMGVGDWNVILSTNIPLRRDGLPYSGMAQPKDPGVAVYFKYKEKQVVLACDTYRKVEDNVRALAKTVEAMRGIERWGASDMLEKAFTGFQALPPAQSNWWEVLEVPRHCSYDDAKKAYREKALKSHPDSGGSEEQMKKINVAFSIAEKELGK